MEPAVSASRMMGPAMIANDLGKGRTMYIAGSLEAHYISSRVKSLRTVLASTVRYLARDSPPPFTIDAPTGVYGVLRQTSGGDLVLWVLANVGFSYDFPRGLEIYGRLNNFLNQKYEEALGFPALHLNFLTGVKFQIPSR